MNDAESMEECFARANSLALNVSYLNKRLAAES